jgi:hypothetical protein
MSTEIPHIPTDMDAVRGLLIEALKACGTPGAAPIVATLVALAVSLLPNGKRARAAMVLVNARLNGLTYGDIVQQVKKIAEGVE